MSLSTPLPGEQFMANAVPKSLELSIAFSAILKLKDAPLT